METPASRFSEIIAGLRAAIADVAARNHARIPLLMALWSRVGRMAFRFERLYVRWQTGTLPKPRRSGGGAPPPRAGQPRTTKPREKSPFPTKRAWLIVTTRETAGASDQLAYFLARPDLAEFLAAVPQAGRILRPLCHMLSTDLTLPGDPPPPPPRAYIPPVYPPKYRAPKRARRPRGGTPDRPPPFPVFCLPRR